MLEVATQFNGDDYTAPIEVASLIDQLEKTWVIIYRPTSKAVADGAEVLMWRGFDTKDQLQSWLTERYATLVAVDGIEMVLENGRPRRFQIEVKPRIGF